MRPDASSRRTHFFASSQRASAIFASQSASHAVRFDLNLPAPVLDVGDEANHLFMAAEGRNQLHERDLHRRIEHRIAAHKTVERTASRFFERSARS